MNDAGKTSVEIYESIEPIKKEISSIHDKAQRMYETKKEGSLFSKEEDKEVSELLNEVQTFLPKRILYWSPLREFCENPNN